VYQGSSGRVYPNPVIDRVSDERTDQTWAALHLGNEYVRLMVLPEIGGRIHVGLDRTNGYDFFYRQNVIKPALVGYSAPGSLEASSSTGLNTTGHRASCRSTGR